MQLEFKSLGGAVCCRTDSAAFLCRRCRELWNAGERAAGRVPVAIPPPIDFRASAMLKHVRAQVTKTNHEVREDTRRPVAAPAPVVDAWTASLRAAGLDESKTYPDGWSAGLARRAAAEARA